MVKDSTYLVPSLVSGMQYSTHTILLQIYSVTGEFYTSHRYRKREGAPLRVSSKGGAPFIEEGFVLAEEKGFQEFQVLGFLCRCLGIILGGFSESFSGGSICIKSEMFFQEEGAPLFGGYLDLRI